MARGIGHGIINRYAISVVVLAVILIGGVTLLKNTTGGTESETSKPVSVETSESKTDNEKAEEAKTEETPPINAGDETETSETTAAPTTTGTVATTGPTEHVPEELTATGPEDLMVAIIGLVLVGTTLYTAWDYVHSRAAVHAALLRK